MMTIAQQQLHEACCNLQELAARAGYYITLNKQKPAPKPAPAASPFWGK